MLGRHEATEGRGGCPVGPEEAGRVLYGDRSRRRPRVPRSSASGRPHPPSLVGVVLSATVRGLDRHARECCWSAWLFAAGNAGRLVTIDLGLVTLYRVPVTFVAFGGMVVGMGVMLLAGINSRTSRCGSS